MLKPKIVTGDDVTLPVTLKKNGATFDMSSAAVKAAIVSNSRTTKFTGDVAQSSGTSGADWLNSLVVVVFSSTDTAISATGPAWIEIQVDDGGLKTTWFVGVELLQGNIA